MKIYEKIRVLINIIERGREKPTLISYREGSERIQKRKICALTSLKRKIEESYGH